MSSSATNGQKPVDVLLVGLGSIGSIYAYLLEKTGRARVTAVARSNYDLYTQKGVTLDTEKYGKIESWRPHRVVKSQAEALSGGEQYDFCFVTTKCLPDVNPTEELLKDAIASGKIGAWTLLQNGIGVEDGLYQAVKQSGSPVLSNLAWVGMMTSPDGAVVSWKGWECLVSGIYPSAAAREGGNEAYTQREKDALEMWTGLIREGGATAKTTDSVEAVRFSKNVWNCGWSSIQGLTRTRPASYAEVPHDVTQPLRNFMREIVDVGFGSGLLREGMIQYPMEQPMGNAEEVASVAWTKILETSVAAAKAGGGHKMSLWVDVEMGRPIEVEVIVGGVVRLARKYNIQTPLLDYTYALLKGLQVDLLSRRK